MSDSVEIDQVLARRALFRRLLDTPDGHVFLALLRNECGVESMNPATIKPELVALCNWIHIEAGIYHPLNMVQVAAALLRVADDEDLYAKKKAQGAEED
ncbi:MAG TPA: hypothetical protein PLB91_06980 [Spirochaetales bacterium]|nr:hypothetical protein [Spirochaetales bacterium]HRY53005.1 hypothetical protein [Spirochaetia bacterium]